MYAKQLILTASISLFLSGAALAQGPALMHPADPAPVTKEEAAATRQQIFEAHGGATSPVSAAAEANKQEKVDAATAADARFQANRTEANMVARDKAEAEAAAAIQNANGPTPVTEPQQ